MVSVKKLLERISQLRPNLLPLGPYYYILVCVATRTLACHFIRNANALFLC